LILTYFILLVLFLGMKFLKIFGTTLLKK